MSDYRINPTRIRVEEREPREIGGQGTIVATLSPIPGPVAVPSENKVAVKKLEWNREDVKASTRFLKSFVRNLNFMATLFHPNIVKLVGFVEDMQKGDAWLILPWEENGNVREFLQSGEWDIPERMSLIQDTVNGVEYLHTREPPICHGDIRSFNILVNASYHAVITGLESARRMQNVAAAETNSPPRLVTIDDIVQELSSPKIESDHSTLELTLIGPDFSLRWTAPEVLNNGVHDVPSDMWSIGWTCWEIITGRIPFEELKDVGAIVSNIVKGELPEIREEVDLSRVLQLCSLIMDCWMSNPAERIDVATFRRKISFMPSATPSGYTSGEVKIRSVNLLLELGRMYNLQNNTVMAESHYQSALDTASRASNATAKAKALIGLGDVHCGKSKYSKAEAAFKEAYDIHSSVGNDGGAANALIGLGGVYNARSRYREAEKAFVEAHEIYSRIGHDRGVADALTGLGEVYGNQSKYREAEKAFMEAHVFHSGIGNERGVANALTGMGRIFNTPFRYAKAERTFRQAHEIHSRTGNKRGAANALIGLGEVYGVQSRYQMAEEALMEACEIHARVGNDHGVANASISLGRIFNVRSKYFDAEKAFTKAYELHSRFGNDREAANALIGLGQVNDAQSKYRDAEKALLKALGIHSYLRDECGTADALIGLGELHGDQLRYREAEEAFIEAERIYSRISNDLGAAQAAIGLGEIWDSQSGHLKAEETFNEARRILSSIDDDLPESGIPRFLAETDEVQSTDSEGGEAFKGASEVDSRVQMETIMGSHSLEEEEVEEEEGEEQPHEISLMDPLNLREMRGTSGEESGASLVGRIHNNSGSASTVYKLQQANFIEELVSIESISMPSMQYIIDLIRALAKTAPTAIRNKHQLYRILIISRDLCYHLDRMAPTGSESSSGLNVLVQCWEIMDNLERILLELCEIVSQEAVPFGVLSLATWNKSRTRLSRIYGKLTAPPFDTCSIDNSANAIWDRYFDDCSWLSLLLLEGIETPVRSMHPEADEENFPIEARNVIERLDHLVNEVKLNESTDEPTRELFIKILSDLADEVMPCPENLSTDFWDAAAGALQDIDLEKGLDQDVVDSLRHSWGRFVDRQIQQVPAPRAATPAPSQDPIDVSLPQELTRLDHEITPAAELLVLLLQSLGRGAPTTTRNKHKIYAIVSRARDICNHILAIGARPEVSELETLDEYYNLIDSLERILLDVARLLPAEQVSFGREMCVSWSESREEFWKILNRLHEPPFRLDLSAPEQELTNNSVFDDYYWLSLLLEEGIEKELVRQHLGVEMPPAVVSETSREVVIDIATRLYEALSVSGSEKGSDAELPIRSGEPRPPITMDKKTLVTALSIAFSVLDLDSSLEPHDIHRLAGNWWGISHSSPMRHSGNQDEGKLAETGLSSQVKPVGQGDQETSPDPTKSQNYWLQLHKMISRRNLAYSEEMDARDKVRNEKWIVTINITGEDVDTLRLTGAGLLKREAQDAVARLALIVFGEIVGEV